VPACSANWRIRQRQVKTKKDKESKMECALMVHTIAFEGILDHQVATKNAIILASLINSRQLVRSQINLTCLPSVSAK
jgi:hypothetical protein